ncbi:MAG: crotonase/enoyl-CoA hydratase family protein [Deltaproteobacteria bacterium]|nr:MAG: crotonase/enoyl-CoA hydratase family protein [Deltaproteobacteria bacterium]
MSALVNYSVADAVAAVIMDDGKRNVLSLQMFAELSGALDRAEADRVAVVLAGRAGTFSAGFDLRTLGAGGPDAYRMVRTGFELAERMLAFPTPIVVACTGDARAMGAFLLLSADYRLGATGAYTIQANEVAIGITMPFFGVEICRQRLTPAHFQRAVINAEAFPAEDAVHAGFLDHLVPAAELLDAARSTAVALGKLPRDAHAATKLRARAEALKAVHAAIDADDAAFRGVA